MRVRRWMYILIIALFVWGAAGSAWAAGPAGNDGDGGVVQVDSDWVLATGETHEGDVLVIQGNAIVERGARLKGNLAVISGDAVIRGTVDGDISVIDGDVLLKEGAIVLGDVNVISGRVQRASMAQIRGNIHYGTFKFSSLDNIMAWPYFFNHPRGVLYLLWRAFWGIVGSIFTAVALAAIAALITAVWPLPTQRVARTVTEASVPAFFVGLGASVAVVLLALLLIITVCLLPFWLLLLLAWLGLGLLGWTALGYVVGEHVWRLLNVQAPEPVWTAAVGTLIITLLSAVPCVGSLFLLLMGSVAIGAVLLSHFGTYVPGQGQPSLPVGSQGSGTSL